MRYAAKGETARALDDYGKALAFNRRNVNAYIARGALYLAGGAMPKARADIAAAARLDRKNAYAVLWQEIAERRAKQKGVLAGGKGLRDVEMKGWPAPLLAMFAGELKPDGALTAADDPNPALKAGAHLRGEFLRRPVSADPEQPRRSREAVRGGREEIARADFSKGSRRPRS